MPNRILKDSIRTSSTINALSDFQFRLWAYLITYVDDFGRGRAEPDIIKGFVLPRRKGVTEANIQSALSEMACMGLIQLYDVDGDSYLCFPNWQKHQNVRAAKSKFPSPEEGRMQLQADDSNCNQVQADAPVTRYSLLDTRISNLDSRASRFTPPKLDEVREYAKEKNWTLAQFDPEYFVDFYTSKGWKVGKETMKDWKACARGWVARGSKQSSGGRSKDWHNPALDYQQRGSDGKVDESNVQYWTAEQYEELARLCGTEDSQ